MMRNAHVPPSLREETRTSQEQAVAEKSESKASHLSCSNLGSRTWADRRQPAPPGRLSQRFEDLLEERDEPNRKGPAVPPLTAKGALVGGAEPRLSHRPDQAPGSVPARGPGPGHHPQGANRKLGRELRIRHGEPSGCPVVRILLLSLPRAQVQSLLREIHSASQEAKKRNRKKKKNPKQYRLQTPQSRGAGLSENSFTEAPPQTTESTRSRRAATRFPCTDGVVQPPQRSSSGPSASPKRKPCAWCQPLPSLRSRVYFLVCRIPLGIDFSRLQCLGPSKGRLSRNGCETEPETRSHTGVSGDGDLCVSAGTAERVGGGASAEPRTRDFRMRRGQPGLVTRGCRSRTCTSSKSAEPTHAAGPDQAPRPPGRARSCLGAGVSLERTPGGWKRLSLGPKQRAAMAGP